MGKIKKFMRNDILSIEKQFRLVGSPWPFFFNVSLGYLELIFKFIRNEILSIYQINRRFLEKIII